MCVWHSSNFVFPTLLQAAVDACKLMGCRRYYEQMIRDELQYQKHKITDEIDVATVKDYMQVRNVFVFFLQLQVIKEAYLSKKDYDVI